MSPKQDIPPSDGAKPVTVALPPALALRPAPRPAQREFFPVATRGAPALCDPPSARPLRPAERPPFATHRAPALCDAPSARPMAALACASACVDSATAIVTLSALGVFACCGDANASLDSESSALAGASSRLVDARAQRSRHSDGVADVLSDNVLYDDSSTLEPRRHHARMSALH